MRHLRSTVTLLATVLALSASSAPATRAATSAQPQVSTPVQATAPARADWGQMPLYFIANQGQIDARVAFYVQGRDKTLYFAPEGITFALTEFSADPSSPGREHPLGLAALDSARARAGARTRYVIKLDFVEANPVRPVGQDQTDAVISYLKGPPEEWYTGLPTYGGIVYRDLWEGIDLVYSGTVDRLKYEFRLRPGADPARIRLAYRGATVQVNATGQLEVTTPAGGFQDDAPVAYQDVNGQRVPVSVGYLLDDASTYGFRLGAYDPALPLVIDPAVLVYCGYIGGSGWEEGEGIAVDGAGNAYVVGDTDSTQATFPVIVGPDLDYNGNDDIFVAKVKADGTGLDYCGYIGGSGQEYVWGVAVDGEGNAYIGGETNSSQASFPVLVGPDLTHNGWYDAFVAKVKADGTGLDYCGYIGGTRNDYGHRIAVDGLGHAYLAGSAGSWDGTFPTMLGPDPSYNGGDFDGFVAKVKTDGSGLDYCGFIGGNGWDEAWDVAVDGLGHAYIVGDTDSEEDTFPVIVGPDLTYNDDDDAFVAKVKADGTGLDYCGYIGGSGDDFGGGIAVDAAGNAYIGGETNSTQTTFPVAVGPDLTHNGGYDAFVAKVKADGTGLDYCGYIGGSSNDYGHDVAVDGLGGAHVVGATSSTEASFPVKIGPDRSYNGGPFDAFAAKVTVGGTALAYCGYIGGSGEDSAWDIAVDGAGDAYVVGVTDSTEATFPVAVGPDLDYNQGWDVFVAKILFNEIKLFLPLISK